MTVVDMAKSEFFGLEPSLGLLRFITNVTGAHIEAKASEDGVNVSLLLTIVRLYSFTVPSINNESSQSRHGETLPTSRRTSGEESSLS